MAACRKALAAASSDEDFLRLDEAAFGEQPALSFDVAVMERTDQGVVVPIDIGWSAVGSWDSLYQVARKDDRGTVPHCDDVALDRVNRDLHRAAMQNPAPRTGGTPQ